MAILARMEAKVETTLARLDAKLDVLIKSINK
jgi:hypothetical protein